MPCGARSAPPHRYAVPSPYEQGESAIRDILRTALSSTRTSSTCLLNKKSNAPRRCSFCLLLKITIVKTFKTLTVASFVLSHFMNSVVNSVEVLRLSVASDAELV